MKNSLTKFFLALTLGIFLFPQSTANAKYSEAWEIDSFASNIYIQEDGTVDITEIITADFSKEAHRGIERSIPYKYENGYNAQIEIISSVNEKGEQWKTKTFKEFGNLYVQMTTKDDSLLKNKNTYKLNYTAENVITFQSTHDEFYWNVNGADWVVPTKNISAAIHLPKEFKEDEISLSCFSGMYGAEERNCKWERISPDTVTFWGLKEFAPYENLTIVVGLPKGTIPPPSKIEKFLWLLKDNPLLPAAPITLILMLLLWYKYGRDERIIKDTVMPHFTPPKELLPSETGTLFDEQVDPKDITASIIDHAVKGNIKITEIDKNDYEFELIKPYKHEKEFEEIILSTIFVKNQTGKKEKLSELKPAFNLNLKKIEKSIIKKMVEDGYFPHSPKTIRAIYGAVGGVLAFLGVYITANIGSLHIINTISVVLSGFIIIIIGNYLPRKTQKGAQSYYELKGLYEYINTAEKDRMKFQEENKILFEKLLPYAIAFGLVKKWANAFEGILKTAPVWFVTSRPWSSGHFTMSNLGDRLNSFSTSAASSLFAPHGGKGGWSGGSGFGGGGFSGGGFGGGGGRGL